MLCAATQERRLTARRTGFGSHTPEAAVDRLEALHDAAIASLRAALERCLDGGVPPDAAERARFRYPLLRVTHAPRDPGRRVTRRAWAKFQRPGVYQTTVTQPAFFRRYLLEQLRPLSEEFGALIEVGPSTQDMPFPYVLDRADTFDNNSPQAALLAAHFPTPSLAEIGDEAADGLWQAEPGAPLPLSLFDGARVDYSLRRLVHYTGTDWRAVQPWILLTNYHRYVDQFLRWGLSELARPDSGWTRLVLPGGIEIGRDGLVGAEASIAAAPWHRFQMPASR
jgi:AMP nucleosidase